MAELLLSVSSNRSDSISLEGEIVSGNIYVFVSPETGITQVSFFLDDPSMSGPSRQVENNPPYDFSGTARNGEAHSFDTTVVADGTHTITAAVDLDGGGTELLNATFTVAQAGSCSDISPLSCPQVRLTGAHVVDFGGTHGGLTDKNGVGTGFTMVDSPSNPGNPNPVSSAPGYWAEKLEIDAANQILKRMFVNEY